MKRLIQIIASIAFVFAVLAAGKLATPRTIPATLEWQMVTNVSEPFGHNITFADGTPVLGGPNEVHTESVWVSSNLVATIVWKKETNTIILEHHFVSFTDRKYRITTERVYEK